MKKQITLLLFLGLSLLLSACGGNLPSVNDSDPYADIKAIVQEIAPLIEKDSSEIYPNQFERMMEGFFSMAMTGYVIENQNFPSDPFVSVAPYFQDRESDVYNLLDDVTGSILGFQKEDISCLLEYQANASWEEVMESENYPGDYDFHVKISCGRSVGDGSSETEDGVIFGAYGIKGFGVEPFWGFSLYEQTLSFSTPEGEQEFPVTVYAVGGDFTIQGEEISGELSATTCRDLSKGDDHYFTVNLHINGIDYKGCADFQEFYAIGDDFFKLEKIGFFSDLVKKFNYESNLTNSELNKKKYRVGEISQSYVLLEMDLPNRDSVLVINHGGNDIWSVVREGREVDYDICQEIIYKHPDALNLRVFQDCLDPNLAAG